MNNTISVECADIIDFACDVLVLKYAQNFYGVDALVANLLRPNHLELVAKLTFQIAMRDDGTSQQH